MYSLLYKCFFASFLKFCYFLFKVVVQKMFSSFQVQKSYMTFFFQVQKQFLFIFKTLVFFKAFLKFFSSHLCTEVSLVFLCAFSHNFGGKYVNCCPNLRLYSVFFPSLFCFLLCVPFKHVFVLKANTITVPYY